jgi:hypothetical protein
MSVVISWDIGTENLAYSVITNKEPTFRTLYKPYKLRPNYYLLNWGLIKLNKEEIKNTCVGLKKNGQLCQNNAKYGNKLDITKFYCKTHCGKDGYLLKTKKKVKNTLIQNAIKIKEELNNIYETPYITHVQIENQPCTINYTMKSIQMIIFSYYAFKYDSNSYPISIINVNAKLKEQMCLNNFTFMDSQYYQSYLQYCKKIDNSKNKTNIKYLKRKQLCESYVYFALEQSDLQKSGGQILLNNVPDAIPNNVPDTIPNNVPDTIPNNVPDTIPNNVPDTIPNNVPDAIPNNVPDAIPNNVPDKTENKLYNKDFYNEYVSIIKRNDISDSVCMGINCLNSLG